MCPSLKCLIQTLYQFCNGGPGLIPNQNTKTGVYIHPSILVVQPWSRIPDSTKNCWKFGTEGGCIIVMQVAIDNKLDIKLIKTEFFV